MSEARLKRPRISEEEKAIWRQMEAEGKKRSHIANERGYDPSLITRHLGPTRKNKKAPPKIAE